MLIPIGIRENVIRRHAVVSYAIIVLNVVVFFALLPGRKADQKALYTSVEDTVVFLSKHPYVDLPRDLSAILSDAFVNRYRQVRAAYVEANGMPPRFTVEAASEELARRVSAITSVRHRMAAWRYGLRRDGPLRGYVTYTFLHAGYWHLFGNMLVFFLVGPFLEDVFGRLLFTALYVSSGVVAGIVQMAKGSPGELVVIGASGAIAGVMGAFLIRLFKNHILFLFIPILFLPMFRWRFSVPAYIVLPFWFLEQYVMASVGRSEGVAWWAHVGGFVFGAGIALFVAVLGIESRFINPGIESRITWTLDPRMQEILDTRENGRPQEAFHKARALTVREPDNVDAWQIVFETALEAGRPAVVGRAAGRLLQLHLRHKSFNLIPTLVERYLAIQQDEPQAASDLPARFWVEAAAGMDKAGQTEWACRLYGWHLRKNPTDPEAAGHVLRLAELLSSGGRTDDARQWLQWAKTLPSYPAHRRSVDRRLAELSRRVSR